jgi:hypothetical protein
MKKPVETMIQIEIKDAAKALIAVHIDAGNNGITEAVRLARIPEGALAPGLLAALEKMIDIFGAANPAGVGLTLGDIACDQAREAIKQAKAERI